MVEVPAGWEYSGNEESNEIVITKGDASVSVAVLNNDEGITVERFLEYRKSILRQQCPAAEFRDQGKGTVAGVAGASFAAFCPGPGQPTLIRVSAAFNYWKFFVFSSTVPVAELPAVQSDLDRMAASFKAGDGLPEGRAERMRAR